MLQSSAVANAHPDAFPKKNTIPRHVTAKANAMRLDNEAILKLMSTENKNITQPLQTWPKKKTISNQPLAVLVDVIRFAFHPTHVGQHIGPARVFKATGCTSSPFQQKPWPGGAAAWMGGQGSSLCRGQPGTIWWQGTLKKDGKKIVKFFSAWDFLMFVCLVSVCLLISMDFRMPSVFGWDTTQIWFISAIPLDHLESKKPCDFSSLLLQKTLKIFKVQIWSPKHLQKRTLQ